MPENLRTITPGQKFAELFGREPTSPADCAWLHGYAIATGDVGPLLAQLASNAKKIEADGRAIQQYSTSEQALLAEVHRLKRRRDALLDVINKVSSEMWRPGATRVVAGLVNAWARRLRDALSDGPT